jgi:hypothetical protein
MVPLTAFICVLEPVHQRKSFSKEKHKIFLFQVFYIRFFTQIFMLQQWLDPNPYPNPNLFRIQILTQPKLLDSDPQHCSRVLCRGPCPWFLPLPSGVLVPLSTFQTNSSERYSNSVLTRERQIETTTGKHRSHSSICILCGIGMLSPNSGIPYFPNKKCSKYN